MAAYSFNPNSSDASGFDKFESVSQSLVLDSERGELVEAPVRVGKKEASEAKAMAALRSHSEAERRRRKRINAHLDTLRGLVPYNGKMDKATLLAEVISQVKELKKNAIEASKGVLVPTDSDEVTVEQYDNEANQGTILYKASLCCDYRPDLLSDLKQALESLQLHMIKAEISTLGDRLKNVFVFRGRKEGDGNYNVNSSQLLASEVHHVLSSILDKSSSLLEYSPRMMLSNKRRKISYSDSFSSST